MLTERRTANRLDASHSPCVLRLAAPGGRTLCLAIPEDVSPDGGRLIASAAQPAGTTLRLEPDLTLSVADWPPLPPFVVGWCEPRGGGGYLLGGAFARPLTRDELARLT